MGVRIRFGVWLVSGYARTFLLYFPLSFSVLQKRLNSAATQIVAFKQSLPTVVLLDSILAHMARTNDRAIMRRPEIMPRYTAVEFPVVVLTV